MSQDLQFRLSAAIAFIVSGAYTLAGLLGYIDCLASQCAKPYVPFTEFVFGVVAMLAVAGLYVTIYRLSKRD